jgi:DNA-directed RNA polymerase specialized sigma24 family protein
MTTYDVTVTRDGGLWAAVISGLPPRMVGATDVERFADLDVEVRDLIAGLTDTDPDSFGLRWRYLTDGQDVTSLLETLFASELAYAQAVAARDAARREVIVALADTHLSQSAIGDVLGLSHQRVHQLIKAG